MITRKYRRKQNQGFSLIEILVVVTIIALLIAILIPVTSRALAAARINAAIADMRNLKTLAVDAASRMGGTLPITEAITDLNRISDTLRTFLGGATDANRLVNLNALLSLDNVFMSMNPSMMDDYYQAPLGLTVAKSRVDPPLGYNSADNQYTAQALALAPRQWYNTADGFGDSSRIECAPVSAAFAPGTGQTVNAAGGINFMLDGVNWLPAGVCVYMVYELVPKAEAYELSKRLNPPTLINPVFTTERQINGRVIYNRGSTTTVYVYLANF